MTILKHQRTAARIRDRIRAAELAAGSQLPSEAELATEHQVSRSAVRSALQLLEREGLLTTQLGVGWFVRDSNPLIWWASRPENVDPDAWTRCVRDQGREPTERVTVAIDEAPEHIARLLNLALGEAVVVRRRLRYADGDLICSCDSYYPHSLVGASRIARPGEIRPGAWKVMADLNLGWDDDQRPDEMRARPAVTEEAAVFNISLGAPVIEHIRVRRTTDGTPVTVMITVAPGDRLTIVYEPKPRETQ